MRLGLPFAPFALLALLACGDSNPKPEPKPEPARAPEPEGFHPDWQRRVDDIPGTAVLTWVNGPILKDGLIQVGSSAIGVASIDARTGKVVEQDKQGGEFIERPEDLDLWFDDGVLRLRRGSLERVGKWTHELDDEIDVGASDPVIAGDIVVMAIDRQLIGLDYATGERLWKSDGFAHEPGTLRFLPANRLLLAVAFGDEAGPVSVSPSTGEVGSIGDTVTARMVWSATRSDGALALVVKRDREMLRDSVVAFRGLRLLWEWDLPRPDGPRVDPIGVLIFDDGVFVFYDGRYVVRLPL